MSINGAYYDVRIVTDARGSFTARCLKKYFGLFGVSSSIIKAVSEEDKDRNTMYIFLQRPQHTIPVELTYIVYNLETKQQSPWYKSQSRELLDNSLQIFDFSVQNYVHLETSIQQKMAYLPAPLILQKSQYESTMHAVLSYGATCARRSKILTDLQEQHGIRDKVVDEEFGNKVDEAIRNAKIVLNLHCHENALLETSRINEALQYDKIVVSEEPTGADKYSRHVYKDVVVFTESFDNYDEKRIEKLARLLKFYSAPRSNRRYVEGRKTALYSLTRYLVQRFAKALLSLQAFPPTYFYERLRRIEPAAGVGERQCFVVSLFKPLFCFLPFEGGHPKVSCARERTWNALQSRNLEQR